MDGGGQVREREDGEGGDDVGPPEGGRAVLKFGGGSVPGWWEKDEKEGNGLGVRRVG